MGFQDDIFLRHRFHFIFFQVVGWSLFLKKYVEVRISEISVFLTRRFVTDVFHYATFVDRIDSFLLSYDFSAGTN